MHDRVLGYFNTVSSADIELHSLESIALCQMALDEHTQKKKGKDNFKNVPSVINSWLKEAVTRSQQGVNRRTQPLIRSLLAELQTKGMRHLQGDEIRLLLAACDLAERSAAPAKFRRMTGILSGYYKDLVKQSAEAGTTGLMEGIERRVHLVTTRDLIHAPPKEVKKFAGLNIEGRGPVYRATHGTKVIGSVPENCTLVVEKGSCTVEGFVLGKVAAVDNCDVQENIAGVVVVRKGHISARNVIDHAQVISKTGSVYVRKIMNAELVFAGQAIEIKEDSIMGSLTSRRISVKGELYGGLCHVVETARASCFRNSENRPLTIALARTLSCEDYGEELGPKSKRHIAKATRLKRLIQEYEEAHNNLEREAQEAAETALYFVTGQKEYDAKIESLEKAQRRLTSLNRTVLGIHLLSQRAEENLYRVPGKDAGEKQSLDHISTLISKKDDDESATPGSSERMAATLGKALQDLAGPESASAQSRPEKLRAKQVLEETRHSLRTWIKERQKLAQAIAVLRKDLAAKTHDREIALDIDSDLTSMEKLEMLLTRAEAKDVDENLATRLRAPLATVMFRSVRARLSRASLYEEKAEKLKKELETLADRLRTEFQIDVQGGSGKNDHDTRITGRFENGVRLVVGTYLVDADDPPEGSRIYTDDSEGQIQTYVRREEGIVEEK
jgi:hypothetical protein